MRLIRRAMGLLGLTLLSSFAFVGCDGSDGVGSGNNGGGVPTVSGNYRNVSAIDTNNANHTCPGSAANGNTTFSCGDTDTLALNANGTYTMTGIDSGVIGSGNYTVNGNTISFTRQGTNQPVTATITQNGNRLDLKWTSDIFTGITLVYQKQ